MLITLFQPHLLSSSSSDFCAERVHESRKFPEFLPVQRKFSGGDGHYSNQITRFEVQGIFAHNFQ